MKFSTVKTNFTAGELSPKLLGRVEIDRYANAGKELTNAICEIYGGARRRYGTFYRGIEAEKPRLIPYIFSQSQSYVLAFSKFKLAIYKSGTGEKLAQLETVFDASEIPELDYTQGLDSMFLFHRKHWPQLLRRGAAENEWSIQNAIFDPPPCEESGHKLAADLTIVSNGGSAYTLTLSNQKAPKVSDLFLSADVGRVVLAGGMEFTLLSLGAAGAQAQAKFEGLFTRASFPAGSWTIAESPLAPIYFNPPGPINAKIEDLPQVGDQVEIAVMDETKRLQETRADNNEVLLLNVQWKANVRYVINSDYTYSEVPIDNPTQSPNIGTWVANVRVDVKYGKDINGVIGDYPNLLFTRLICSLTVWKTQNGVQQDFDTGIPGINIFRRISGTKSDIISRELIPIATNEDKDSTISLAEGQKAYDPGSTTIRNASVILKQTFRASDVGALVRVNNGLFRIISQNSGNNFISVQAVCLKAPNTAIAASAHAWELLRPSWNDYDGYPVTGCLHQQRLIAARGRSLWFSSLGQYFSFLPGMDDDDAFSPKIDSGQANGIHHLASQRRLIALTPQSEWTITGSGDTNALTPSKLNIDMQSKKGSTAIKPIAVGDEMYFISRARRKLFSMGYDYSSDSMKSPNMTILSEQITAPGISEMAYQNEPNSTLMLVRDDGKLAVCALEKEQNVIAWSKFQTAGNFVSACCVPVSDHDEVWAAVKRGSGFFIESFSEAVSTDAAAIVNSPSPSKSFSGFSHLAGKEVDVLADDKYVGRKTVDAAGNVVLDFEASKVEAGLPYSMKIVTLTPEAQTPTGSMTVSAMAISDIMLRVLNTQGCKINGVDKPFKAMNISKWGDGEDIVTGDVHTGALGWKSGNAEVTLEADKPLPFYLLSLTLTMSANEK